MFCFCVGGTKYSVQRGLARYIDEVVLDQDLHVTFCLDYHESHTSTHDTPSPEHPFPDPFPSCVTPAHLYQVHLVPHPFLFVSFVRNGEPLPNWAKQCSFLDLRIWQHLLDYLCVYERNLHELFSPEIEEPNDLMLCFSRFVLGLTTAVLPPARATMIFDMLEFEDKDLSVWCQKQKIEDFVNIARPMSPALFAAENHVPLELVWLARKQNTRHKRSLRFACAACIPKWCQNKRLPMLEGSGVDLWLCEEKKELLGNVLELLHRHGYEIFAQQSTTKRKRFVALHTQILAERFCSIHVICHSPDYDIFAQEPLRLCCVEYDGTELLSTMAAKRCLMEGYLLEKRPATELSALSLRQILELKLRGCVLSPELQQFVQTELNLPTPELPQDVIDDVLLTPVRWLPNVDRKLMIHQLQGSGLLHIAPEDFKILDQFAIFPKPHEIRKRLLPQDETSVPCSKKK